MINLKGAIIQHRQLGRKTIFHNRVTLKDQHLNQNQARTQHFFITEALEVIKSKERYLA